MLVHSGKQAALYLMFAQLLCVALLLAACDMGGGTAVPTATQSEVPFPTERPLSVASPTSGKSIGIIATPDVRATSDAIVGDSGTPDAAPTDMADALTEVAPIQTPTQPPAADLPNADTVAIYSKVVADLLAKEKATSVYISPYVGQGERLDDPNEDMPLPASLEAILHAADPKRRYQLSNFTDSIGSLDDGGKVKNGGVFLTLGQITVDGNRKSAYLVRASIYRGVGSGSGNSYTFKKAASSGVWQIASVTQDWNDQ